MRSDRPELVTAADRVAAAADATESGADRLADLADQLDRVAESRHRPDHGQLARIQAGLAELRESADDDAVADIDAADDAIDDFREGLEGV